MDQRIYPSGVPAVDYTYTPDPGGQSGVLNPTDFQALAKEAVAEYYNQFLREETGMTIVGKENPVLLPDEVFVVWFCKTLQNWKALCSTMLEDNRYFELTYNGDKRELYVDEYVKKGNRKFVHEPTVAPLTD